MAMAFKLTESFAGTVTPSFRFWVASYMVDKGNGMRLLVFHTIEFGTMTFNPSTF